jgi:hypothetical protein
MLAALIIALAHDGLLAIHLAWRKCVALAKIRK